MPLSGNMPSKTFTLRDLTRPIGPFGLDKRGLAAAINVSEQDISDWIAGASQPPTRIADQLQRAVEANTAGYVILGKAWGGQSIVAPTEQWEPSFTPVARFMLPFNVDWSGPEKSRWQDARDEYSLDMAYRLILDEGGLGDIIRWIDPGRFAERFDLVLVDRYRRAVWPNHLKRLGFVVVTNMPSGC
jgi:hypothetical protein